MNLASFKPKQEAFIWRTADA